MLENPDEYGKLATGRGDLMEIFIKVKEEKIDEITVRIFLNCGDATSSMTREMTKG